MPFPTIHGFAVRTRMKLQGDREMVAREHPSLSEIFYFSRNKRYSDGLLILEKVGRAQKQIT